jgi:hydrogenase expression/formation protein HypC
MMCLVVPRRVLQIDGDRVQVKWEGGPLWASTAGIGDLRAGEYVLVHAGLVMDRITPEEAGQIRALYDSLERGAYDLTATEPTP